ncbi:MAG: SRPBCC domain-containing protein, partial [Pseudomonadota bacterium]|nr:SRPBCC domain-containing protein [Pseudomonadota bacterium]
RRLPDADETRIRQELEGNLCRCTGYVGIVRAVKSVLDLPPVPEPDAATEMAIEPEEKEHVPMRVNVTLPDNAIRLTQNIAIAQPAADVWRVFRDIETVASCMPGARLAAPPRDGHVVGRIVAALGPIRATFSGSADIEYDDVNRSGTVLGSGRDNTTGSGAVGEVTFTVRQDGTNATQIQIEIAYSLNGALAQFGRGDLAAGVAQALTNAFAANLEAHLSGGTIDTTASTLGVTSLFAQSFRNWLAKLFGK